MKIQKLCISFLLNIFLNKKTFAAYLCFLSLSVIGDSFNYNIYNNHGVIGLINMPSARFYNESVYGITLYDGAPDQKITMTSSPYDWMEASFFIRIFKVRIIVD